MLLRELFQGSEFGNAGVGENDIDTPLHFTNGLVKAIKVGEFGNVSPNSRHVAANGLHGLVEFLLATARDEDIGTLPNEELCRSQSDPRRAARDNGDLTCQLTRSGSF